MLMKDKAAIMASMTLGKMMAEILKMDPVVIITMPCSQKQMVKSLF